MPKLITPLQAARLAKKQTNATNRKVMLREFAISNTKAAFFYSPSTTDLTRDVDGKTDHGCLTEDDIISSVKNGEKHGGFKRNKLDASPDNFLYASFLRTKIKQSALDCAEARREKIAPSNSVHDIFTLDRSKRDLYDWLETI